MGVIEQAEQLISELSRGEKAKLLQILAREVGDASSGIESRPDICGGEPVIVRTRIPVWLLEQARRLGVGESELPGSYPTLRPEDLLHAWVYAGAHPKEMDEQIRANEAA